MRGTCKKETCDVVDMDPPVYTMVITSLEDGSALGFYCSFNCMIEDMKTLVAHADGGGTLAGYEPGEPITPVLVHKKDLKVDKVINVEENLEQLRALHIDSGAVAYMRNNAKKLLQSILEGWGESTKEGYAWTVDVGPSTVFSGGPLGNIRCSSNLVTLRHRHVDFEVSVGYTTSQVVVAFSYNSVSMGKRVSDQIVLLLQNNVNGPLMPFVGEQHDTLALLEYLISDAYRREAPVGIPTKHIPAPGAVASGKANLDFWPQSHHWAIDFVMSYVWQLNDIFNAPVPSEDTSAVDVLLEDINEEAIAVAMAEDTLIEPVAVQDEPVPEETPALAEYDESIVVVDDEDAIEATTTEAIDL